MHKSKFLIKYSWLFGLLLALLPFTLSAQYLESTNGTVRFLSDAPLERIEANSNELRGILDPEKQTFAFQIASTSFLGFNSPLQRTHFNENYLESDQYSASTFVGKIIENIDLSKPGEYSVRAKGKLTIHGITRERIIRGTIAVNPESILIAAEFSVLLEEHDIDIPRIVHQKIAEEIEVWVQITLSRD